MRDVDAEMTWRFKMTKETYIITGRMLTIRYIYVHQSLYTYIRVHSECTYVHLIAFRPGDTYTEGYSNSRYVYRDDVALQNDERDVYHHRPHVHHPVYIRTSDGIQPVHTFLRLHSDL